MVEAVNGVDTAEPAVEEVELEGTTKAVPPAAVVPVLVGGSKFVTAIESIVKLMDFSPFEGREKLSNERAAGELRPRP